MSRYEHLKTHHKKAARKRLTSTQIRFLMAIVIAVILFSVQLVMYLKK